MRRKIAEHAAPNAAATMRLLQNMSRNSPGPLLDRIDLQIEVTRVPFDEMARPDRAERSSVNSRARCRHAAAAAAATAFCRHTDHVKRRDAGKCRAHILRARLGSDAPAGASRCSQTIFGTSGRPHCTRGQNYCRSGVQRRDYQRARGGGDSLPQSRALRHSSSVADSKNNLTDNKSIFRMGAPKKKARSAYPSKATSNSRNS
jgi:hypothetical protein